MNGRTSDDISSYHSTLMVNLSSSIMIFYNKDQMKMSINLQHKIQPINDQSEGKVVKTCTYTLGDVQASNEYDKSKDTGTRRVKHQGRMITLKHR